MPKFSDKLFRRGRSGGSEIQGEYEPDPERLDLLSDPLREQFEAEDHPLFNRPSSSKERRLENRLADTDNAITEVAHGGRRAPVESLDRFHDRVRRGKVKLCGLCGGVMTKGSRMILSPLASALLLVLGLVAMAGYGIASNFYQVPWFLKFMLPATYYIGSILIGFGVMFFFVRERVWKCHNCREISRR